VLNAIEKSIYISINLTYKDKWKEPDLLEQIPLFQKCILYLGSEKEDIPPSKK